MKPAKEPAKPIVDRRMAKEKGYLILGLIIAGIISLWLAVSSWLLFATSIVCLSIAYYLYYLHVKNNGMTIQEAFAEGKKRKDGHKNTE